MMEGIASRLAAVRRRTGLSGRGFAAELKKLADYSVSHTSVRQYESGTTVPAAYIAAVCRTFGVDPEWLLHGRGLPEPVENTEVERAFEQIARIVLEARPVPTPIERELEAFFRLSPDLFCLLTPDGYFAKVNPAWTSRLGYGLEELTERRCSELVHAEDVAETESSLAELLDDDGAPASFENRVRHRDGSYRWLEWSAIAASGLIYAVARDVTEAKRTEMALRQSRAGLALAQRIARLGNWDWDIRTNTLAWSDEIYRLFGLQVDEFEATYDGFLRRVHDADRTRVQEAVHAALYADEPYDLEHRIVLPSGEVRVVHERAEVERDEAGAPVRMVGTVQDVTDRRRAEAELRRREKILEAVPFAADRFLRSASCGDELRAVLTRLGSAAEVSRVYVTLREPNGGRVWHHTWETEGIGADADSTEAVELTPERLGDWLERLERGDPVQAKTAECPERQRAWLRSRGVRSVLLVPVMLDDRPCGLIGFDDCRASREWSTAEVEAAKVAAGIMAGALQHTRVLEQTRTLAGERAARLEAEASRRQMRSIVESISDPFLVLDRGWRFRYVNGAAERLLGRSASELIDEVVWESLPEDVASHVHDGLRRAVREDATVAFERYVAALGRWIEVHAYPFDDGLSVHIRDVTSRREALEARRVSEAKFAGIVAIASDAIISVNDQQEITLFNKAAEETFGYTADEVLGEPLDLLIPEAVREAHRAHVVHFAESDDVSRPMGRRLEVHGRRRDGETFPAEAGISKFRIGDTSVYTVILRDITERKEADAQRRRRHLLLKLLHRTAVACGKAPTSEDAIAKCLDLVCEFTDWPVGHAYLRSEDGRLHPSGIWHEGEGDFEAFRAVTAEVVFDPGEGLPGRVADGGNPEWITDVTATHGFIRAQRASEIGVHGAFAIPISSGSEVVGVLEFFTPERVEPDEPLLEALRQVGSQVGFVFERERAVRTRTAPDG